MRLCMRGHRQNYSNRRRIQEKPVKECVKYIRKGELVDLHSIHGVDADVIELEVKESSKICNHSIQELDFPRDAIIGGVIRNSVAT